MESLFLKPSIFNKKSLPTCQLYTVTVILSPISWTTLLSIKQIFVSLGGSNNKDYYQCGWNLIWAATYTVLLKDTHEVKG